ncbi:MAG: Fe(2+) transporter permease subunit FeoB [Psychromonas sp.]|nr:Fe(2+) transporter permease subunit FeoB [Psychromonas sp.]
MSFSIATVGNPNSGKTTLFNALTGSHQQIGNWSGVTVEKKTGFFKLQNTDQTEFQLIDLPGIYSLDLDPTGNSRDERVAFNYIMGNTPDLIINIIDASCLERSLYLTLQLMELGLPVVVVLNKMDVATNKQLIINKKKLSQGLGCPVVSLCANNQKLVKIFSEQLLDLKLGLAEDPLLLDYNEAFTPFLDEATAILNEIQHNGESRALAIKLLEGSQTVTDLLDNNQQIKMRLLKKDINLTEGDDIDLQIADTRYTFIYDLSQTAIRYQGKLGKSITTKIDAFVMNRFVGIPFFLLVMYLMFMFSINIGTAFQDFFDILGGAIFVDGTANLLNAISSPPWLVNVLAYGVGNGIQTVLTFIPIIGCLYLFLAMVESSGYLARAAFVVDKAMQFIGLPGKSFVPMIVGFGCTVPAVMAARTLKKERERLLTVVMSPFMSCGARLPVYALFASAFFPHTGQNIVFLLYIIGIVVAILTGVVLSRTLLPGKSENMFLELPDYELPTLRNVALKTWQKLKVFLLGAGKIIVIMVTLLNFVNSVGIDGSFGHQNSKDSMLSRAARIVTPILAPMGVTQHNWPATVGIVTGLFAKEAVIGTLNNLYLGDVKNQNIKLTFKEKLNQALSTIPENLMGIRMSDPLGIKVGDLGDLNKDSQSQGVAIATYKNIQKSFVTGEAAFAYLLFILLYAPCAAAMGAIVREVGGNWAKFIAVWTTSTAYIVAVCYYQVATNSFSDSLMYLAGALLIVLLVIYLLKQRGDVLILKRDIRHPLDNSRISTNI